MLDWIHTIWDYNYWAHRKLWDSITTLSEADFTKPVEYSIGSVHKQIVHVVWAEAVWYARIHGEPRPTYAVDNLPTRESIREAWDTVETKWRTYLNTLSEDDLTKTITYTRGNDEVASNVLREILGHVVNHGTDYRAQILRLLHDYGAPTFEQDMFFYFRALKGLPR